MQTIQGIHFLGVALTILLFAGVTPGFGQTAEITGRVTDSSGAVIPDSSVVAFNVDTGVRRPVKTNESGYYSVPLLPPGRYEITAQMSGFKPLTRSGVRLEVGQIARIDFVMELGEVTESITVDAQAPLVSSEEASVGTVVDGEKVHQLPLNGRDPFSLVTLTPGVTSSSPSSFGRRSNISGGRENTSDVLIDGGATTSVDQGDLKISPPLEAVSEFKVQTASFEAEYGRSASVITMVTKSGTNELHGSLFEFIRNDAFDANNFFFNRSGQGKQKLRYHQFGGAIGGPVYIPKLYDGRNRTFFFFTAEYTRQRGAGLVTSTVPTALERDGDFSQSGAGGGPQQIFDPNTTTPSGSTFSRVPFANSVIPASRFHPVALNILNEGYPLPISTDRANNFIASGATSSDVNSYTMRGDHYFAPENRLSIRYSRSDNESQNAVAYPEFPGQGCSSASCNLMNGGIVHSVVLRDIFSIRPTVLNEFTYGLLYNTLSLNPASANQGWSERLGFTNTAPYLFPTVNISGYSGLFGGNLSSEGDVDHQFSDNITWIKGAHTIKAGFEVRSLYFRNQQPGGNTAGNVSFNALPTQDPSLSGAAAGGHGVASLLLGIPSNSSLSINDQKWGATWRYHSAFVQDKWKISPQFTLTYGLRWEYTRPRKERWNRQSVFNMDTLELMYA
ncbi:MAG: carboxypeptidase regulatory-like domain-containing protein, partial [Bryobacteraceae bacterium]